MLVYKILGNITPKTKWEDFIPENKSLSRACITSDTPKKLPTGTDILVERAEDNWCDCYVREFNVKSAKQALAKINGVSPEEIEVIQLGIIQSI